MKNMMNILFKFNMKVISAVLISIAVIVFMAAASNAAGVSSLRESVVLDELGGAKTFISIVADLTGEILIPCSLPNPDKAFIIDGSSETALAIENRGGSKFIKLSPKELKSGVKTDLRYEASGVFDTAEALTKDFGNIEMKYAFVNGTGEKIGSFEVSISLPPQMIVNTVNDYLPKLKKDDASDPFVLSKKDGRRTISLKFANMKFGDRSQLRFAMKNEKRPSYVWIIFMIITIWYLIMFRDVIHPHGEHKDHKKKKGEPTAGTADAAVSEKGPAENKAEPKKE